MTTCIFQAPWVKVDATGGLIQIDAASLINASSQAPKSLPQNGVNTDAGGIQFLFTFTYFIYLRPKIAPFLMIFALLYRSISSLNYLIWIF